MRGSLRPTHPYTGSGAGTGNAIPPPNRAATTARIAWRARLQGPPAGADVSLAKGGTNRYRGA